MFPIDGYEYYDFLYPEDDEYVDSDERMFIYAILQDNNEDILGKTVKFYFDGLFIGEDIIKNNPQISHQVLNHGYAITRYAKTEIMQPPIGRTYVLIKSEEDEKYEEATLSFVLNNRYTEWSDTIAENQDYYSDSISLSENGSSIISFDETYSNYSWTLRITNTSANGESVIFNDLLEGFYDDYFKFEVAANIVNGNSMGIVIYFDENNYYSSRIDYTNKIITQSKTNGILNEESYNIVGLFDKEYFEVEFFIDNINHKMITQLWDDNYEVHDSIIQDIPSLTDDVKYGFISNGGMNAQTYIDYYRMMFIDLSIFEGDYENPPELITR